MGWGVVDPVLENPAQVTSLSGLFEAFFAEMGSGLVCTCLGNLCLTGHLQTQPHLAS